MRVLLVPANTAKQEHIDLAISIIKGHKHEVVRWSFGTSTSDADAVIVIPGRMNTLLCYKLWLKWDYDDEIDMEDAAEEAETCNMYFGKGVYNVVEQFKRTRKIAFMIFPDIDDKDGDQEFRERYFRNDGNRGPAFIVFDHSDTSVVDSSDFNKYCAVDIECISDTRGYKYNEFCELCGFQTDDLEIKFSSSYESFTEPSSTSTSSESTLDINLLLLRRAK